MAKLDRIVGVDGGLPTGEEFELYVELNEAFHNELFVLADQTCCATPTSVCWRCRSRSRASSCRRRPTRASSTRRCKAGNAGHHEILNAIERGDADLAERLAREHAQLTVKNLESVLETGGLEKLPGSGLISDVAWASPGTPLQA